jgi:predicted dehydrogenase
MEDVRLCVIGAGQHALAHIYPCFHYLKHATVVANCARRLERAQTLARSYGISYSYTDYRKMIEEQQPDGVLVCVAPDFHATAAIDLMELGCHVYTEKPPAETTRQTRAVFDAKRRTGRICMTAFKKRFAPAYTKTKEIISSDTFGDPTVLSMLRTWGNYVLEDDPRGQYILDSGIHAIDLASFLFGRVVKVSAMLKPAATYAITLQFANKAVGTLTLTDRMSTTRPWEQLTVIGSNAVCVQVDNSVEMLAFQKDRPFAAHKPEFGAGTSDSQIEMGFVHELQAFVDAIVSGQDPESSIESAVHTMEIIEGIQLAATTGDVVTVDTLVDAHKRRPIGQLKETNDAPEHDQASPA